MTRLRVLAPGYWIPDGIAVIGEGEFLFADRGGALYHYAGGRVTEVRGLPPSRTSGVFGGLLDVSLHPGFADTRLVYIAYNDASFDLTVADAADHRRTSASIPRHICRLATAQGRVAGDRVQAARTQFDQGHRTP
jgi:hypothetical protein